MTLPASSIETPRLLLRVPELADAQALMDILWDPEAVEQKQVTLSEPPGGFDLALRNTKEMIQQWELRGGACLHDRPHLISSRAHLRPS